MTLDRINKCWVVQQNAGNLSSRLLKYIPLPLKWALLFVHNIDKRTDRGTDNFSRSIMIFTCSSLKFSHENTGLLSSYEVVIITDDVSSKCCIGENTDDDEVTRIVAKGAKNVAKMDVEQEALEWMHLSIRRTKLSPNKQF